MEKEEEKTYFHASCNWFSVYTFRFMELRKFVFFILCHCFDSCWIIDNHNYRCRCRSRHQRWLDQNWFRHNAFCFLVSFLFFQILFWSNRNGERIAFFFYTNTKRKKKKQKQIIYKQYRLCSCTQNQNEITHIPRAINRNFHLLRFRNVWKKQACELYQ